MFIQPVSQGTSNNRISFKSTLFKEASLAKVIKDMWVPDQITFVKALNKLESKLWSSPDTDTLVIRLMPPSEAKGVQVVSGHKLNDKWPLSGGLPTNRRLENIYSIKSEDIQLEVNGQKTGFCTNLRNLSENELVENLYKAYEYIKGL